MPSRLNTDPSVQGTENRFSLAFNAPNLDVLKVENCAAAVTWGYANSLESRVRNLCRASPVFNIYFYPVTHLFFKSVTQLFGLFQSLHNCSGNSIESCGGNVAVAVYKAENGITFPGYSRDNFSSCSTCDFTNSVGDSWQRHCYRTGVLC